MGDEMRRQVTGQSIFQRIAYEVFAGHKNGWITILDDGAGDGYFYDEARRRSGGSFFYCFTEDGVYRFFRRWPTF